MAAIHCLSCNRVSECNLTMTSPLRSRSSLLICLCYPTWQSPHKPQNAQSCFQSFQLQRTLHFKIFKGWWAGFVIAPQCVSVLLILTVEIVRWAKGKIFPVTTSNNSKQTKIPESWCLNVSKLCLMTCGVKMVSICVEQSLHKGQEFLACRISPSTINCQQGTDRMGLVIYTNIPTWTAHA